MSFPLNLAMFSLLLFRSPIEYDINTSFYGVPQFNKDEYINDSLLFEGYDTIRNNINGNVIETQLGSAALANNLTSKASLYFYRLATSYDEDTGYLKENYCPLYVSKTKVNTSSFVNTNYQELFKLEFNLNLSQELYVDMVVDEEFGDTGWTAIVLNNRHGSHYYDYRYVFNVDYAYYEPEEAISSLNNDTWYSFDLKNLFNSSVVETEEYFRLNLATLDTHIQPADRPYYITQLNNYICFKNNVNFSEVSYDSGFVDGYNVGVNENVDKSMWIYSFIRSVFNGFAQVLNVEILPNIKLGYLIAIPLVLSVLRFILGFFKGD